MRTPTGWTWDEKWLRLFQDVFDGPQDSVSAIMRGTGMPHLPSEGFLEMQVGDGLCDPLYDALRRGAMWLAHAQVEDETPPKTPVMSRQTSLHWLHRPGSTR